MKVLIRNDSVIMTEQSSSHLFEEVSLNCTKLGTKELNYLKTQLFVSNDWTNPQLYKNNIQHHSSAQFVFKTSNMYD